MMDQPLFDSNWHRVKDLKPSLAADVRVSRQLRRGVPVHVLHRASTRTWYSLGPEGHELIKQLNGKTTVDEIWHGALESLGENAPGQKQIIDLLASLHEADLLSVDRKLNAEQMFERAKKSVRRDRQSRFTNPLFMRFNLVDPNKFLEALHRLLEPFLSNSIAKLLAIIPFLALLSTAAHSDRLNDYFAKDVLLQPSTLLLLAFIYPLMKLIHEAAHGVMIKHYGGDVREAGLALMVLMPNPYVDASAVHMLADKHQRILVSCAGVFAEVFMASIATFVWIFSTGTVAEISFAVMLIGTASTLLFNGNPLMKFDGYYAFSDWIEIQNLQSRSSKHLKNTLLSALRLRESLSIDNSSSTSRWLLIYGIASKLYRLFLTIFIVWTVSQQYYFMGLLISLWVAITFISKPIKGAIKELTSPDSTNSRRFALFTIVMSLSLATAASTVPLPGRTVIDGVVWLPDQSVLHVSNTCQIQDVSVRSGTSVNTGQSLLDCTDEDLQNQLAVISYDAAEIRAKRSGLASNDPVNHQLLGIELDTLLSEKSHLESIRDSLNFITQTKGMFVLQDETILPGRHLEKGAIAGYIIPESNRTIRLALDEFQMALLNESEQRISVRLEYGRGHHVEFDTKINRQTPQPTHWVPSATLTRAGGGVLPVSDSRNPTEVSIPIYDLELEWPAHVSPAPIGARVFVKIEHAPRAIASRIIAQAKLLASRWRSST